MFNKNIILTIAIASCAPSYTLLGNHDSHHSKTDDRKLDILKKELEELTNIEKKLILNEDHMPTTKICFWTFLGSAGIAALAQVLLKGDTKDNVQKAAGYMAATSGILGVGSSVNQGWVLHNIDNQKKNTLKSMDNVK